MWFHVIPWIPSRHFTGLGNPGRIQTTGRKQKNRLPKHSMSQTYCYTYYWITCIPKAYSISLWRYFVSPFFPWSWWAWDWYFGDVPKFSPFSMSIKCPEQTSLHGSRIWFSSTPFGKRPETRGRFGSTSCLRRHITGLCGAYFLLGATTTPTKLVRLYESGVVT